MDINKEGFEEQTGRKYSINFLIAGLLTLN